MEQLRIRNFILCFVGGGYYAFVHRTFLEYFCAWSFVWQFMVTQALGKDGLINDVFGSHWRDEKWHEVLRLISGMIDAKFVGDIISYLMEQDGEEEKFQNLFLAGKCMSEVRSSQGISDVESRLLDMLKDLTRYDLGYFYESYDEVKLVREIRTQAVKIVATFWKDEPSTYTWLEKKVVSDESEDVRAEAVRQIATGWKQEPGIFEIFKQRVVSDESDNVRREAVRQIATSWKQEPGILELLKQWVVSNKSKSVRAEAVEQIATGWKQEPGILELLKQWVVSHESHHVRAEAVRQIATGWKQELGILELLKQRVVSDESHYVRREAVRQIATGWKQEPGILELLKQWVVSHESHHVRAEAVRQIATGWKQEPGIFEILYDKTLNDPFQQEEYDQDLHEIIIIFATNPRHIALEAIVKQYLDHPQTLPLLQDRAENDPDEKLQKWAKKKLQQYTIEPRKKY